MLDSIPLARKLQQSQMFGNLADECLEFAQQNREEWVKKGREAVQEMMVDHMQDDALLEMIDQIMFECDAFV